MTTKKPASMDEYISGFPDHSQKALEEIRTAIKKIVPDAEETISYGIPCFKLNGTYLIYFAGYKHHIGIYPVPTKNEVFERAFSEYKTSGKGTLQLPLDQQMPIGLITQIVEFKLKENTEKTGKKKIKTHHA